MFVLYCQFSDRDAFNCIKLFYNPEFGQQEFGQVRGKDLCLYDITLGFRYDVVQHKSAPIPQQV